MASILPNLCFEEIFNYFDENEKIPQFFSCFLVNRHWCRNTVSFLWENPFYKRKSLSLFHTLLTCLDKEDKQKYLPDLVEYTPAFYYYEFIKYVNIFSLLESANGLSINELNLVKILFIKLISSDKFLYRLDLDYTLAGYEWLDYENGYQLFSKDWIPFNFPGADQSLSQVRSLTLDENSLEMMLPEATRYCPNLQELCIVVYSQIEEDLQGQQKPYLSILTEMLSYICLWGNLQYLQIKDGVLRRKSWRFTEAEEFITKLGICLPANHFKHIYCNLNLEFSPMALQRFLEFTRAKCEKLSLPNCCIFETHLKVITKYAQDIGLKKLDITNASISDSQVLKDAKNIILEIEYSNDFSYEPEEDDFSYESEEDDFSYELEEDLNFYYHRYAGFSYGGEFYGS
ncbi:4633_t:CDS:1 [Ambispora leptoticha]|uniref:4633_t:CDS:1 n=1 Tax=Ambispora leptoticha TaxID=144679 RepID=A0A9N9D3P2_9GLOM|nr:4633_t:CDS:1 [Ambispora leptoticha]